MGAHLKNAAAYNKEWQGFLQQKRTKEEILKFAGDLAGKYGFKLNF